MRNETLKCPEVAQSYTVTICNYSFILVTIVAFRMYRKLLETACKGKNTKVTLCCHINCCAIAHTDLLSHFSLDATYCRLLHIT